MALIKSILVAQPFSDELLDRLRQRFETVHYFPQRVANDYYNNKTVEVPSAEILAEVEVLICWLPPKNLIHASQVPKLRFFQLVGAGTNHITSSPFYQSFPSLRPFVLANASGLHATVIAEHVLMTTMALNHALRQFIVKGHQEQRWVDSKDVTDELDHGVFIQELRGQTVGILGFGNLGREIGRVMKCFGVKLIACTREGAPKSLSGWEIEGTGDREGVLPDEYAKIEPVESLHAFLSGVDVLVNCLPASPATSKFLGAAEFKAMKNSAIVVNVGRGETMDTDALVEALQAKGPRTTKTGDLMLRGASLDVTDPEPLPPNHPLFTMENVILTPHVSWSSKVNWHRVIELLVANVDRIDAGQPLLNVVP